MCVCGQCIFLLQEVRADQCQQFAYKKFMIKKHNSTGLEHSNDKIMLSRVKRGLVKGIFLKMLRARVRRRVLKAKVKVGRRWRSTRQYAGRLHKLVLSEGEHCHCTISRHAKQKSQHALEGEGGGNHQQQIELGGLSLNMFCNSNFD